MGNIKSFPNNRDEYIGAEYAMRWLHGRTSGVFAADNNAAVSAVQSSMAVAVSDGLGWLTDSDGNGIVWWNDAEKSAGAKLQLMVDSADGVLNRIDRVIVEWQTTDYADLPEIKILKGTASSTAAAPALTNNGTKRQISLAQISVAAGTTAITASMITDERLDPAVCGLVTESVSADTSVINAQFAALLTQLRTAIEQAAGGEIPDGTITHQKLAAGAVGASNLADDAVTRAKMAIDAFTLADNAGAHNAVYRGKNLGSAVTAAQWAAIQAGTFEDLFIGDYWMINDVSWRIAAFDYYYQTGDAACTTHHVVIVPDTSLYNYHMNDTNITTGGYAGSKMHTKGLAQAKTTINSAFGSSHILSHRQMLVNAVTNGKPSGGSWYDSTVELMSEQNVYGGKIFGACNDGSTIPYLYTIDKSQFPLFAHDPSMISNRQQFWLRDIVSATRFADVYIRGNANYNEASASFGVRPYFCIG